VEGKKVAEKGGCILGLNCERAKKEEVQLRGIEKKCPVNQHSIKVTKGGNPRKMEGVTHRTGYRSHADERGGNCEKG